MEADKKSNGKKSSKSPDKVAKETTAVEKLEKPVKLSNNRHSFVVSGNIFF